MSNALRPVAARGILGDGARFLLAGLVNFGLTVLVYQAVLFITGPSAAYTIAWSVGLVFVYLVYPSRVFVGGRHDRRARIVLVLNYVVGFLIGLATINLVSRQWGADRLAIFVSIVVMTAYTFVSSRLILRRNRGV